MFWIWTMSKIICYKSFLWFLRWASVCEVNSQCFGRNSNMVALRQQLQSGLEVIRVDSNHGLDVLLVVKLARTFADRVGIWILYVVVLYWQQTMMHVAKPCLIIIWKTIQYVLFLYNIAYQYSLTITTWSFVISKGVRIVNFDLESN